ncbi:permease [bacterium]|nr:permease [bacterium]MBU4560969.1 permease [bacterium]MCG2676554.1 permease [bacterium]
MIHFLIILKDYIVELLPVLAIGFFLSGIIHEFLPTSWVERHLGGKGMKPLLYATISGALLPLCCFGALPVAISFFKKGARLGPVLAFLVATPATSATAILVTYRLLGLNFTLFLSLSVILIGLTLGLMGNLFRLSPSPHLLHEEDPVCGMCVDRKKGLSTEYEGRTYYFCSPHCQEIFEKEPQKYVGESRHRKGVRERVRSAFKFGFWDLLKEIGPELALGLVLAALIMVVTPVGRLIGNYLSGGFGYLFALPFGLAMYICSTASVPLVHAFLTQGMNIGAGLVLLIVGPVTSFGTILVVRKEFGTRILFLYLFVICALSLLLGYAFSQIS